MRRLMLLVGAVVAGGRALVSGAVRVGGVGAGAVGDHGSGHAGRERERGGRDQRAWPGRGQAEPRRRTRRRQRVRPARVPLAEGEDERPRHARRDRTAGRLRSTSAARSSAGEHRGNGQDGDPIRHAFLWQNGRMRDLGTLRRARAATRRRDQRPRPGRRRGRHSAADGTVRDQARVPVAEREDARPRHARADGTSSAVAINERGQVVGSADHDDDRQTAHPISHAFLWQNGKMRDLGTLGGPRSERRGDQRARPGRRLGGHDRAKDETAADPARVPVAEREDARPRHARRRRTSDAPRDQRARPGRRRHRATHRRTGCATRSCGRTGRCATSARFGGSRQRAQSRSTSAARSSGSAHQARTRAARIGTRSCGRTGR